MVLDNPNGAWYTKEHKLNDKRDAAVKEDIYSLQEMVNVERRVEIW